MASLGGHLSPPGSQASLVLASFAAPDPGNLGTLQLMAALQITAVTAGLCKWHPNGKILAKEKKNEKARFIREKRF